MVDSLAVREAFRARVEALVSATTGSATLAATTTGYTRTAGSFLTDGFADGMEVVGTGFSDTLNTARIVGGPVTALSLPITGGLPSSAVAAAARTLTVGLPLDRRWQGTQTPVTTAPGVRPHVDEQRAHGEFRVVTFPADGGETIETGLYILTWFFLSNRGIKAIELQVQALKRKFTPGTVMVVNSRAIRIMSGIITGSIITTDDDYESVQISIPWQGMTVNAVAA